MVKIVPVYGRELQLLLSFFRERPKYSKKARAVFGKKGKKAYIST